MKVSSHDTYIEAASSGTAEMTLTATDKIVLNTNIGDIYFQKGGLGAAATHAFFDFEYVDSLAIFNKFQINNPSDIGDDYFNIVVGDKGATTINAVDDAGAEAHLTLDVDGDITLDAASGNIYVKDNGSNYTPGSDYEIATKKYVDDNAGGGASALNDLSDVTYSSGDLTISSLDKIISGSLDFDSSGHINFDGCAAGFTRTTYADAADVEVDFTTGNKAHLDMTGGSISGTLTLKFPAISGNFVLVVQQDGSTRTINAYPTKDAAGNAGSNDGGTAGAIRWAGGSAPDLTDGGNKRDVLSFYWDATEEVCYGVASLNF